jgi:hypothetical protein
MKIKKTSIIKKTAIINIIILLIIFIVNMSSESIIASVYADKEQIKDSFYQSVNYNPVKNLLSFTIPKAVPKGYKFYLHVSGRMYLGNKSNGMSFHAFDEESTNNSWKNGKTYTYALNSENLEECLLVYGFVDKNNQGKLQETHIFPDGTKSIKSTLGINITNSLVFKPYVPPENSREELYQDIFMTLLLPNIQAEVDKYYKEYLTVSPTVAPYDVYILNAFRVNGYRGFDFRIKIELHPYVGPHIEVGIDYITVRVRALLKVEIEKYEHIKSYELPSNYKSIIKKKLP